MSVKADMKYSATVRDAFITESPAKGTTGLFLSFQTEDGPIAHTIWVTPATVNRVREDLGKCFGITGAQLQDDAFLEGIGAVVRGQNVQITTEMDDFKDEPRVIVKWMNPAVFTPKRITGTGMKRVTGLFGGGPVSSPAYSDRSGAVAGTITDDDVPF